MRSIKTYTVCTRDGELIGLISREQRNTLRGCTPEGWAPRHDHLNRPVFNQPLIEVHRKRDSLYYALVDAAVIHAELRREFGETIPNAEDNCTTRLIPWCAGEKAGRYIEHNLRVCETYPVRLAFLKDEMERDATRDARVLASRNTHAVLRAPIQAPLNNPKVIPFPAPRLQPPNKIRDEQPDPLPQAA